MLVWSAELSGGEVKVKRLRIEFVPARTQRVVDGWDSGHVPNSSQYPIEYLWSSEHHMPFVFGFQIAISDSTSRRTGNGVTATYSHRSVTIPLWCTVIFGMLPSTWLVRYVKKRRRFAARCCTRCGS
jgi:hypothetical protein